MNNLLKSVFVTLFNDLHVSSLLSMNIRNVKYKLKISTILRSSVLNHISHS